VGGSVWLAPEQAKRKRAVANGAIRKRPSAKCQALTESDDDSELESAFASRWIICSIRL